MEFNIYSAPRNFFDFKCHHVQYYDEWAHDYAVNDIIPYWDDKKYWDKFPIKIAVDITPHLPPGKDIAGAVAYTFEDNNLHIKRIFTCKRFRKQGIASKLMEHAWENGFNSECKAIRMWCDKDAISFYEKLGFNMLGVNDKQYGYVLTPILDINMHKSLNKTKNHNGWYVLKKHNITIPKEAQDFTLSL